jgi:hypothetical protein
LAARSNATPNTVTDFGEENVASMNTTAWRADRSACARSSARRSGPAPGSAASSPSYTCSDDRYARCAAASGAASPHVDRDAVAESRGSSNRV